MKRQIQIRLVIPTHQILRITGYLGESGFSYNMLSCNETGSVLLSISAPLETDFRELISEVTKEY